VVAGSSWFEGFALYITCFFSGGGVGYAGGVGFGGIVVVKLNSCDGVSQ
jgi:hypothetical protein